MEALIAYLNSILALKARQGWIFLIIGSVMLLLVWTGILPRTELGAGWLALFWLAAVTGVAILVVSGGAQAYTSSREKRAAERKAKAEAEVRASLEADAVRNAEILMGPDAVILRNILSNGEQRFTGRNVYGLYSKGIVRSLGRNNDVYEVSNAVWEDRQRLIDRLRRR